MSITDAGGEEEGGTAVAGAVKKAARKDAPLAFSTKKDDSMKLELHKFESTRQLQQTSDQGATRTNEGETAHDRDARYVRLPAGQLLGKSALVWKIHPHALSRCLPAIGALRAEGLPLHEGRRRCTTPGSSVPEHANNIT